MSDTEFTWDDSAEAEESRRLRSPLYAWEQDRALVEEAEAATAADALPTIAEPERPTIESPVCLLSELRAGFGVQLLAEPTLGGRSWITCTLNGATQTFEVAPGSALDAFRHPYGYGCTLPL